MGRRPKCKIWNYRTPRKSVRVSICDLTSGSLDTTPNPQETQGKKMAKLDLIKIKNCAVNDAIKKENK